MDPHARTAPVRSATLADVALRADVSPKTVSRVINGDSPVRPKTRDRVLSAIAELNFRPNLAARSLAAAKSFMIGVVAPASDASYYYQVYRGAARACQARGYHLVTEEFDSEAETASAFYDRHLSKTRYDGVLLPPPIGDDEALLAALDRDGVRYARIAPATQPGRSPSVSADDAAGVTALVEHLWALGHRRFGLIAGEPHYAASHERSASFLATVERCGGGASDVAVVQLVWAGTIVETARAAAEALFDLPCRPSAVFCFNDEIAAGAMVVAHQRGLRVPEDVAIAGFDGTELSQFTWPPLTTIRQPIGHMAELAVEALIRRPLATDDVPQFHCEVELIVRASTLPVCESGDEA